jgi:DNA-binding transcriptional ArsR family regulator
LNIAVVSMAAPQIEQARADPLDRLFAALAHPTRRSLLTRLALGPARVTELARPYPMSLPAVSKHLRILEEAGLVSRQVQGRVHRLSLRAAPLGHVEGWLGPFRSYWTQTLHELEREGERPEERRIAGRRGVRSDPVGPE